MLKSETKADIEAKDQQLKMLQQTLKGMQDQLIQSRKQQAQDELKIKELTLKLHAAKMDEPPESEIITLDKDDDVTEEPRTPKPLAATTGSYQVTQKDAKLIGKKYKLRGDSGLGTRFLLFFQAKSCRFIYTRLSAIY